MIDNSTSDQNIVNGPVRPGDLPAMVGGPLKLNWPTAPGFPVGQGPQVYSPVPAVQPGDHKPVTDQRSTL